MNSLNLPMRLLYYSVITVKYRFQLLDNDKLNWWQLVAFCHKQDSQMHGGGICWSHETEDA